MAITLADYNNLQASVQQVLGKGSTTYGYGQAVTSEQLPVNSVITSAQWTNVRNDLVNCVLYQNGGNTTGLTTVLPVVTQNAPITSAILTQFQAAATTVTTNRNPAIVPSSPVNQGTRELLVSNGTYTNWNNLITETITVQFASGSKASGSSTYNFTADDAARFYFNSGSIIEFSATLTGSSGTSKDNAWINSFAAMGTVRFGLNGTTRTGIGPGSTLTSIGYADLTTNDQIVYMYDSAASTYITSYKLKVRKTGVAGQIIFTVEFNDSTGLISGVDDFVTGTTTSICQILRATGYVSLPAPTATRTSSVLNSPTYALSVSPSAVRQGSNQTFTVTTTNIENSPVTTLYWTTNLASTKGSTQGTVNISNNSGTITVATILDYDNNVTTYTLYLRVGSYTGTTVANNSASIFGETPTYSISPNKTTITESSDTVTFTVTTYAVPNGTSLFWKTNAVPGVNSIDAPDFVSIPSSNITINSNTATISLTTVPDYILEGTEAFTISIHLNSTSPVLATSAVVYISDTSTPTGSLSANTASLKLGDTVTFTGTVTGYANGATLYWATSGTAAAGRFTDGTTVGSFVVYGSTSGASGTFTRTIVNDAATHGAESFSGQIYTNAARTTGLGSASGTVSIGPSGTLYYGASSSFSVPAGVKQIIVNGVGGGGGSSGFHQNKGYGSASIGGGAGGGVANYTTAVNTNDNCTFTIGSGGGAGWYVKGGWGNGGPGYATTFAINGAQRFIANAGGSSSSGSTGYGGGGTINIGGSAGSVIAGGNGNGIAAGSGDMWAFGVNYCAAVAIACPPQTPGPTASDQRGHTQRAGWLSIKYS